MPDGIRAFEDHIARNATRDCCGRRGSECDCYAPGECDGSYMCRSRRHDFGCLYNADRGRAYWLVRNTIDRAFGRGKWGRDA